VIKGMFVLNRPRNMRAIASLAGVTLVFGSAAMAACSSSLSTGTVCGPGTMLAEGTCVPAMDGSAPDSATIGVDASADASSDSQAALDADSGSAVPDCTQGKGSSMVHIALDGGTSYCIDSTEVTQTQYAEFLGVVGNTPSGQPAQCSANTTYYPDHSGMFTDQCTSAAFSPATDGDLPIVCVDWCDAYAYCAWAGKRLCRGLGGAAVPSNGVSRGNTEFTAACSSGGPNVYPYGDTYTAGDCVDTTFSSGGTLTAAVAVGTAALCQASAPFSGVYDLVGNVSEWIDACDSDDPDTMCAFVGGNFIEPKPYCGTAQGNSQSTTEIYIGFRCCL
jgi:formylglycine-generating enzyme